MQPNNEKSDDVNSPSEVETFIGRRECLQYTGTLAGLTAVGSSAVTATGESGNEDTRISPKNLQVENTKELIGVDDEHPELSWQVKSSGRAKFQSAYRILVTSSAQRLSENEGDVWDTGKIESNSTCVEYNGQPLESSTRYHWKVRIWDENGQASTWSEPDWWEMGLLDVEDWTAAWIRSEPESVNGEDQFEEDQFRFARKEFDLHSNSPIESSTAYVSAGHQYALHVNGEEVDKGPSFSYPSNQYYKAIDVTEHLDTGQNALAALYNWNGGGQGRPEGEPGLIIQLEIEYENGETETVTTDESWSVRDAPWLSAPTRGAIGEPVETIDGRGFPKGWTLPGFDDSDWEYPQTVGTPPAEPWDQLISQEREITQERIEPETVHQIEQTESPNLNIEDGVLQVSGGGITLSNDGSDWEDYTFELNVRRPDDTESRPAAGFVFRASDDENGYMWQLGGKGGSSELRAHVVQDGEYELLESIPYETELGVWYQVRIELEGSTIRTYINDELVDERQDDTFTRGHVGFREDSEEIGEFDNIRVTGPERNVLLEDDFSDDLSQWFASKQIYVADFGEVVAAIPRVRFENGTAGREIDMRAGYLLEDDGSVSAERGTQSTNMAYRYVQRDGEQVYEPFLYLGFRYFQVESTEERVDPDQIWAIARYNEVPDERAATFSSSNETLDSVWELARHSALHGSQEQFVDTPTREKGQFLGDAFTISEVTMRAFGERKLSQQALREFFRSQERYWAEEGRLNAIYPNGDGKRDIPDYTEKFPEWVWQYYLQTGDEELLAEAYPVVENVAEYVHQYIDDDTGLVVDLAGGGGDYQYGIVDWPDEMRYGYDRETSAMTTVNVLGWNVFRRLGQIADVLNKSDETVTQWKSLASSLRSSINKHLLASEGVYRDGLYEDGSLSSHASQHANAYPLAFGLVPDRATDSVVRNIVEQNVSMGPMTAHRLLFALGNENEYDALLDVITNSEYDGWANILANDGTFTWESWHSLELAGEFGDNRSLSHPWGATVLIAIQRAFLGFRVLEPGASHVKISPPSGTLRSVNGRIPTERGDVAIDWELSESTGNARKQDTFVLDVTIPGNSTATVEVPTMGGDKVRLRENGKPIWNNGNRTRPNHAGVKNVAREEGSIVVEVGSGKYDFELEQIGR